MGLKPWILEARLGRLLKTGRFALPSPMPEHRIRAKKATRAVPNKIYAYSIEGFDMRDEEKRILKLFPAALKKLDKAIDNFETAEQAARRTSERYRRITEKGTLVLARLKKTLREPAI